MSFYQISLGEMMIMIYIGKAFEYYTSDGEKYVARVKKIEFLKGLGQPVFIGVSPYGNEVRLTRREIHRFLKN